MNLYVIECLYFLKCFEMWGKVKSLWELFLENVFLSLLQIKIDNFYLVVLYFKWMKRDYICMRV